MPYTQPAATGTGSGAGVAMADGAGAVDVITADYAPNLVLTDKLLVGFVAMGANITTTPTFNPDGLGALVIKKRGGTALAVGDISAAGSVYLLECHAAGGGWWELLNPGSPASDAAAAVAAVKASYTEGGVLVGTGAGTAAEKIMLKTLAHGNAGATHAIDMTASLNHSLTFDEAGCILSITDPGYDCVCTLRITDRAAGACAITYKNGTGAALTYHQWVDDIPLDTTAGGAANPYFVQFRRWAVDSYDSSYQKIGW
jgi:hypothetical protein